MSAPKITVASLAALVALTLACTKSSAPTSPASSSSVGGVIGPLAATGGTTTASLSDPVTLKVTAPTPISPINNQKADVLVLTATAAAGKFVPLGPLGYRFLIIGPTGAVIQDSGLQPSPSFAGGVTTEVDKVHTWVVRAEFQGAVGPWSAPASFIASNTLGYIRGTELYDPLTNGKTIGTIGGTAARVGKAFAGLTAAALHTCSRRDQAEHVAHGKRKIADFVFGKDRADGIR